MPIITTLKPELIRNESKMKQLLLRSARRFRLNASFMQADELNELAALIHRYGDKFSAKVEVIVDLPGVKRRIGRLSLPGMSIKQEDSLLFKCGVQEATAPTQIPIPDVDILKILEIGDTISLKDGKFRFLIKSIASDSGEVLTHSLQDCQLESFLGYSVAHKSLPPGEFPESNLLLISKLDFQAVNTLAISYAYSAELIRDLREYVRKLGAQPTLIAKIEELSGFNSRLELDQFADEIWFCRGDFGMNVPLLDIFKYEMQLLEDLSFFTHPVVVAGENLLGYLRDGLPSRAEIAHVGFLYQQGVRGIVLSDETVLSEDPVNIYQMAYKLETKYRQFISGDSVDEN